MKKLLSLLATTGLVATTSATAVSCKLFEDLKSKGVTLNKEEIEVEQGKTGEINITSVSDLEGIKITGEIENKVTTKVRDKKITITVSKTSEVKDYILTITGNKINNKSFTVKFKASND
ncbi:lipoprotein [Spiroplasma endosymbiont of Atherix ibis]|uniref:lipoprotein n=1 Tax=Spiroplasma endosymbiont of Atherix ibis TaxID=3066291 RepID=UPI0030D177E1